MTRLILSSLLFLICWSCNNKKENSPFAGLLSSPPYTGISDSIRKFPGDAGLYFRRAVMLNSNDQPLPALADFRQAWSIEKNEKYAIGISNLLLKEQPDSALQFIRQALQLLPESFLLRLSLARALDAQNKTDESLKICDDMLAIQADQVDILKLKASLLLKKNQPEESLHILEKAYQLTPFDLELNYMFALRLAEAKNPKVLAVCDSLVAKDPEGVLPEPYYYKGIYYSNIKNAAAAIEQFNLAIEHDYYYLDAYIEKGSVYYDQKKYTEALKVFQLANTISPAFADGWYWMAKAQEAMGQKDEALLNYQKAIALDKQLKEAQAGIDRLKK